VGEVNQQPPVNGPWRYALSELYYSSAVPAAVDALKPGAPSLAALSQLAA